MTNPRTFPVPTPSPESLAFTRAMYGDAFIEEDEFARRIDTHVAERTVALRGRIKYLEGERDRLWGERDAAQDKCTALRAAANAMAKEAKIAADILTSWQMPESARLLKERVAAYRALSPAGEGK